MISPNSASILIAIFLAITKVAFSGVKENAVVYAQQWQFALAQSVQELVKQGERDPKVIAKLARQRTQAEEKRVREAGRVMGVDSKELDKTIERDGRESLKVYIKDSLTASKEKNSRLKEEKGLHVYLDSEKLVADHPEILKWGFKYSTPKSAKPLLELPRATSAIDLLMRLREEPASVEQNGIWLVVPSSGLSKKDKRLIEDLKQTCGKEGISMFTCTTLESSWKQLCP